MGAMLAPKAIAGAPACTAAAGCIARLINRKLIIRHRTTLAEVVTIVRISEMNSTRANADQKKQELMDEKLEREL
jgi:hypothetical protein